MIFTERRITICKGKATIDEPVILYRGDYEVSIKFTIMESKFRFKNGVNFVDSEKASHGQLAILTPYGGNVFSEIATCEEGTVTFTLAKEMIDQLEEVGLYSFQIRLFDYYRESRVSIPPVEFGIEVREPVASEDHDNTVNNAIVGYSIAKVVDGLNEDVGDTFDADGNYNKTDWVTGDRISQGKLNKIEDALDKINQNEKKDVAALDKRVTNNFNVLDANKADKNEVNSKVWGMANMGQDVKKAMTGGSVAVVGENAILEENIVDLQVTRNKVADGVMDIYPFQPRAKFRHNKNTTIDSAYESDIRGLVKDIKLYNADSTKQYYIQAINRNVNRNYYIAICDSDNVKVCDFNTNSYTEKGGLDTIKLNSTNNSGVSGFVIVDWSKFKQNTGIYGMDYEETGLQIGVIADNDGANLKDYSISKEKLTDDSLMTYPFQIRANFKHNGNEYRGSIRQSVKDIHLYGAKPSKRYAISTLWRCVANERKYVIEIVEVLDDDSTAVVCKTETWYYQEPTGIDEFKLAECNSSGINAVVYIDWSEIPLGDGYYGMKYNETGIDIRCCKDTIPDIPIIPELPKTEIPNIILPQKIYATVGKELNIYYESVVDCDNIFNYKVDVEYNGQGAKQLEECFRVIPNTAGNYTFTLKLYRYGELIASKTCTISVVADKILGNIRGLYIGDSITEANWYLHELQNMISTFKSVGTRGDWGDLNHEGRGSWATTHYLSSASYAGKANAFYNPSSNSFDFNYYISSSSIETPSFVTLALGTNDAGNINADTLVANFNTMINSIKHYDSNMKIGITIAPLPASNQDGWGKCNGVSRNNWTHKKEIFEFAKKIIEVFDNREDEGIYVLPIYVNIDPLLDFPYEEVEASFRNKTIIKRGTDNVHPDKAGMYKISDIHYNWIKAIF